MRDHKIRKERSKSSEQKIKEEMFFIESVINAFRMVTATLKIRKLLVMSIYK